MSENPNTVSELRSEISRHLKYSLGKDDAHASLYDWRMALSLALRDRVVDPWFASTRATYDAKGKRVYYLSMEFLIGRLIEDVMINLRLDEVARKAIEELGQDYDAVVHDEPDAALGNGGLGRLAACFLDSLTILKAGRRPRICLAPLTSIPIGNVAIQLQWKRLGRAGY